MNTVSFVEPRAGMRHISPADKPRVLDLDPETFRNGFNRKPFLIGHNLAEHPLFSLPRLIELSKSLPPEHVEYNAGNVPVSLDPSKTPRTGLSVEETIRRIEDCRSWMVLKYVENDPAYRELLNQGLDQIGEHSESIEPGMHQREGFIFITSPGSITPYHMDPECNFLLQIRGKKQVSLFDASNRNLLGEEELEGFFSGAHRNLQFKEEYQADAMGFELAPGQGLHFPVTWPHWVKNGDAVSISFSITFQTKKTERRNIVHHLNYGLRKRGLRPVPFGKSPLRDALKFNSFRIWRRLKGLVGLKSA